MTDTDTGVPAGTPAEDARPADAAPHPLAALVERWFADHFPGSPVARVTECWNHVHAAVADLKRRLTQET